MNIYGIDFGTTYSRITKMNTDRKLGIFYYIDRDTIAIPSVIDVNQQGNIIVGEEAKQNFQHNGVQLFKSELEKHGVRRTLQGQKYDSSQLVAMLYKELAYRIHKNNQNDFMVLTYPAYYHKSKGIYKIHEAAHSLGWSSPCYFLSEPEAITIGYHQQLPQEDTNVLVIDLGGGTMDVTLLKTRTFHYLPQTIAYDSTDKINGRQWDKAIFHLMLYLIEEKKGLSPNDSDPSVIQFVQNKAEEIKIQLSTDDEVKVIVPNIDITITITREDFEEMTNHLVDAIMIHLEDLLAHVNDPIDKVLLSGGCMYMPMIQDVLNERFNDKIICQNPDKAVVRGAVMSGYMINKKSKMIYHSEE